MIDKLISKAEVLVEALPYMRSFTGKYFVVKYGGHAMVSEELMASVVVDVVLLKYIGIKPVLVHGGGQEISRLMEKMGKKPSFVDGFRITDDETMEIVEMVLVGKVNRKIVSLINQKGGKAIGFSGRDAKLLQARRKKPHRPNGSTSGVEVDLGRVGDIVSTDPSLVHTVCDKGYIPVISSIGSGREGESLNINADYVAGELAASLEAEKLIILTDVEGVYHKTEQGLEFISSVTEKEARKMIKEGQISGGMIPKVESCLSAIDGGVKRAHIIDGRLNHALILEIFTDSGIGTMVTG